MTARHKLVVDVGLLAGGILAFVTGMVLLVAFHMGPGCFRPAALGLSRLAWQNLHRLGAVLTLTGLLLHGVANWRGIATRILRVLRGRALDRDLHELVVYASNTIVLLTGFVAWLVLAGAIPLFGPAPLGPLAHARHPWIDVHHLVGMLALVLTTNHVRRRWHALTVLVGCARREATTP